MICRIKPLRADGGSIISTELRRYNGRYIKLDDGSDIKAGDQIIELHLNGAWFKRRREESIEAGLLPWKVLHCLAQDLNFLAEQMANGTFSRSTALHGSTLLHQGAERLGFKVRELPDSLWKRCAQFYMAGLMRAYYLPAGGRLETSGRSLELKEVWLSRETLLKTYLVRRP